jgi:hypothetical protein
VNDTPTVWELIGAGVAIGGTAVWALAAAARVGVLRAVLELFPRAAWDAVTWGLIPALLLTPIVILGLAVAAMSGRYPAAWAGATAGAAVGSLAALAAIGGVLLAGVRQLPRGSQVWLGRAAPEALIIAFGAAILAGWLVVAARLARVPHFRWAAVPVAAAAVALAWPRAHHTVVAISYVLDRPEANGYFAAVAVGGAVGSAWAARGNGPATRRPSPAADEQGSGVSDGS